MPDVTDDELAVGLARVRSLVDPVRAVLLLAVLALTLRLLALGARSAHWDEARVGYWVLRAIASGDWQYHPVIHGPFLQHVTRFLFPVVGANTTTMRLPVALVGSLLPLAALFFRTRLDDAETVALAGLLAVNPLLLYFSRFMRSDVPLAAFALLTVGAVVRLRDTGRVRWLYVAVLAFALALTTKENAILYLLSWFGAGTAVAARRLWARPAGERGSAIREWLLTFPGRLRPWLGHLGVASVAGAVLLVWFYAPRSGTAGGVGLWNALGRPAMLPAVVGAATLGSVERVSAVWLSGSIRDHGYLLYLGYYLLVLALAAGPLSLLSVVGSRRAWREPASERGGLVLFCGLWGLSGVVGYPYATDILAPWLAVHVVVPLSVPAAVGLVGVGRRLRDATDSPGASHAGERRRAALLAGLLAVAGLQVAVVAGATSYTNPPGELNVVAQAAQPGSNLHPTVRAMARATAGGGDDVDVLYVGDVAVANESDNDTLPAAGNWYRRLPLPWYTEARGLDPVSARNASDIGPDPPPVVVATPSARAVVATQLPGYTARTESLYLRPRPRTVSILGIERTLPGRSIVVFIRGDHA